MQRCYLANKGPSSQIYGFQVVIFGCEHWTIKKAEHWRIDSFELWCWRRLWESLGLKEIQPFHLKGNQSWIFIGRTDAEAVIPILWPPDVKNWFTGKGPDAGKDWGWEEKGTAKDELVGWHHWLNGHEFEQALGVGDGQGNLVCCSPWGCRVRHKWATELNILKIEKLNASNSWVNWHVSDSSKDVQMGTVLSESNLTLYSFHTT